MEIKISKEHGLNPSLLLCPWCGGDKGIALLGRIPRKGGGEQKAPMKMWDGSYEPCNKCKERFKDHVMVIEITGSRGDLPEEAKPIAAGKYPTFRHAGLRKDHPFLKDNPKYVLDNLWDGISVMFMEDKVWGELFGELYQEHVSGEAV